jgi:hypothetical protein
MGDDFDRIKYYHEYFRKLAPSDFNVDRFVDMIVISNIGPRKIYINEVNSQKPQQLNKQKMNEMGLVGPGGIVSGAPDPKTVERFKKYGESGKYGSGMMLVKENMGRVELIKEFIKFTSQVLELKSLPKITLTSDKSKTQTYAHNDIGNDHVVVYTGKRSLGDILRSLAHEIIHYAQKYDGSLNKYENPGETGNPIENEANAGAGILLRNFGKMYPQIFE